MLHQRQHRFERLRLSVDGIDDRLAGIDPQRCFQCSRVGGIKLQGEVSDLQNRLHGLWQHLCFVNAGCADIDIENIGAGIGLRDRLAAQIIEITVEQRLLHALFAGRIDALSDDAGHIEQHGARAGADRCRLLHTASAAPEIVQLCADGSDEIGRGAAAAAEKLHAAFRKLRHIGGKILRCKVIFAGDGVWQTGIRLRNQREPGPFCHFLHHRQDLLRAERAVDADGRRAESFERHCGRGDRAAREGTAVFGEGHGHEHRQIGCFLCREQCGLGFEQVAHRFDDNEIGAGLCARLAHHAERVVGCFKGHLAGRRQELSCRADIQCHTDTLADRFLCKLHGGGDAFCGIHAGAGELQRICAEGVGIDDLRAGLGIGFMYRGHARRLGEVEALRQLTRRKMQHSTHAAVQKNKFLQKQSTKIHSICSPYQIQFAVCGDRRQARMIQSMSLSMRKRMSSMQARPSMSLCTSIMTAAPQKMPVSFCSSILSEREASQPEPFRSICSRTASSSQRFW